MKTLVKTWISKFINNVLPTARFLYEKKYIEPTKQIQDYISHIEKSIENANAKKSQLLSSILNIPGMSNDQNRHFLNNLCSLSNTNYLEIGTWQGSTLISSLYKNKKKYSKCYSN
jgi:hypothetical protein